MFWLGSTTTRSTFVFNSNKKRWQWYRRTLLTVIVVWRIVWLTDSLWELDQVVCDVQICFPVLRLPDVRSVRYSDVLFISVHTLVLFLRIWIFQRRKAVHLRRNNRSSWNMLITIWMNNLLKGTHIQYHCVTRNSQQYNDWCRIF